MSKYAIDTSETVKYNHNNYYGIKNLQKKSWILRFKEQIK